MFPLDQSVMISISQLDAVAGGVLLAGAALHDVAVRTVPNTLIVMVAGCGLGLAALEQRVAPSLVAATLLFGFAIVLWILGYLGGGDAKLLPAAGLLVPPGDAAFMVGMIAVAGGLLCLPYLPGARCFPRPSPRKPTKLLARLWRCEQWRLRRRGPLPYAVAIAAGTMFVLWRGI